MKRFHESFQDLVVGQQVVYNTQGVGAGLVMDDGGVKCVSHHPSYSGRPPIYVVMKEQGRQPSCDLSSSTMQGQALNHQITFRVAKTTVSNGVIMDSVVTIAAGNGSRIRLGYDGTRWYCYVCAPFNGITPTAEYSLVKPLDYGDHRFRLAVRHNRIVGELDGAPFAIPYTVDKGYNSPANMIWIVSLLSSMQFSVLYKDVDLSIQN